MSELDIRIDHAKRHFDWLRVMADICIKDNMLELARHYAHKMKDCNEELTVLLNQQYIKKG